MNKFLLLSVQLFFSISLLAQIPAGYYSAAEGKTEAALKTQLASIISANYDDNGYDGLYNIYKTSDNLPNGKVWDMYSLKSDGTANYYFTHVSDKCGSYSGEGSCYNREHTFCDSWLGEASPQRSDAHHLIPTDGYVNNRRSNFPHGKVASATWTSSNGSKLGSSDPSTGYSGTVFEPIDEFKGDFARMYFYVATRYESKIAGWENNGSANDILAGNTYPAFEIWFYTLMLQWSNQDPVSPKEITRNNVIYTYQNNRNPYIDYPDLANYIWGNKKGQPWSINGTTNPYLILPAINTTLNFGNVAYLQTDTASVYIKAANLTGNLTLAISGTNAAYFTLTTTTLTKAQAEAGYKLIINYNAQLIGSNTAQLIISGGGISATSVILNAITSDDFMALAPSNISATGFTANWNNSANATSYILDVYGLQTSGSGQKVTLLEADFNSSILPTGWVTENYTDLQTSGSIRLASSNNPGKVTSPAVNLTQSGNQLTVSARQYNNDAGAALTATLNSQPLAVWNTTLTNQNYVIDLPVSTANSLISLSAASGKRVYVDNFKIENLGTIQTKVSVNGYPLNVGNTLSYNVSDLSSNSTYYYTVSPQGNSAAVSNSIQVITLLYNGINLQENNSVPYILVADGIRLINLPSQSKLTVYNIVGTQLQKIKIDATELDVKLNKGIYLMQLDNYQNSKTFKVIL